MICVICNKEVSLKGFAAHIRLTHKMTCKEYYDKYLKQNNEGFCITCGKSTTFKSINFGYRKHCSNRCVQLDPAVIKKKADTCIERFGVDNAYKSEDIKCKIRQTNIDRYNVDNILKLEHVREKTYESIATQETKNKILTTKYQTIKQFELENDCTLKQTLKAKYGQGWFKLNLDELILNKHAHFIRNSDIPIIIEYVNSKASSMEIDLIHFIRTFYDKEILNGNKKIISPLELDIYLPDLKLAIECNGIYWHSIETGTPKDYHLNKSILCREKGIRLLHIYEFEDINQQKLLLQDLILGVDNYHKNDFNKNNLIENIPVPEIVYQDCYTIYGAGLLYR